VSFKFRAQYDKVLVSGGSGKTHQAYATDFWLIGKSRFVPWLDAGEEWLADPFGFLVLGFAQIAHITSHVCNIW
jgi:hypothetical protein